METVGSDKVPTKHVQLQHYALRKRFVIARKEHRLIEKPS